jgi:hypothetical protein
MVRTLVVVIATIGLAACGPTLTRTSSGWHEESQRYYIEPTAQGHLLVKPWRIASHDRVGEGYRTSLEDPSLVFTRATDDGVLIVTGEYVDARDLEKSSGVLADRWLDQAVVHPERSTGGLYGALVPPIKTTAHTRHSFMAYPAPMVPRSTSTVYSGRTVEIVRRDDFTFPGGTATELTAKLTPVGAPEPDLALYLAILRPAHAAEMLVVGYSNSPRLFNAGLADARGLAHRIRYP